MKQIDILAMSTGYLHVCQVSLNSYLVVGLCIANILFYSWNARICKRLLIDSRKSYRNIILCFLYTIVTFLQTDWASIHFLGSRTQWIFDTSIYYHILLFAPESGKCIMGLYWVIPFPFRNWMHEYRAIYLIKANNKDTKKR